MDGLFHTRAFGALTVSHILRQRAAEFIFVKKILRVFCFLHEANDGNSPITDFMHNSTASGNK